MRIQTLGSSVDRFFLESMFGHVIGLDSQLNSCQAKVMLTLASAGCEVPWRRSWTKAHVVGDSQNIGFLGIGGWGFGVEGVVPHT